MLEIQNVFKLLLLEASYNQVYWKLSHTMIFSFQACHIAMIDCLMQAYSCRLVTIPRVVAVVKLVLFRRHVINFCEVMDN